MLIFFLLILIASVGPSLTQPASDKFHNCVKEKSQTPVNFSDDLSAPEDSSFIPILQSTAQNLRCLLPSVPRPQLIFKPRYDSHIQAAVICAKEEGIHLRVRSGGHDYECLSYISVAPEEFVLLDMSNMRAVSVDIQSEGAWADAGATIGEVYYWISRSSGVYGFPAGLYSSVGIGGYISGGGYGSMMRKYGLAADNVVDAKIVDADGRILDRDAMGEDVFWAIRGGGGGSFGIILSWKLKLVPVPRTVTVFTVSRTWEQGAAKILYKWQHIADKMDENLFIRVVAEQASSTISGDRTVVTLYNALFLGGTNKLLKLIGESFPELGLTKTDAMEMSWIDAVVYMAGFPANSTAEILLQGKPTFRNAFKAKSDFVRNPIPEAAIGDLLKKLLEDDSPRIIFTPYGGEMGRIPETSTPFPHRKGVICKIQYVSMWKDDDPTSASKHMNWTRGLYEFVTPYVSSSPREAYANYKDLDLGMNGENGNTFPAASSFGFSYFKDNFIRLVEIKTKFDPDNIFRHEQSIPTFQQLSQNLVPTSNNHPGDLKLGTNGNWNSSIAFRFSYF